MKKIRKIDLFNFDLERGKQQEHIVLTYQTFGQPIGSAPVVVVNHSLTGNSNVCGRNGWWNGMIGANKTIDTHTYTIIAFNIPGNGYEDNFENLILNYRDFTIRDIATIFWEGLFHLNIKNVFAAIGGGLGGAIAWEMGALQPHKIDNLIPIASDWKATDKIIANVLLQEQILNNSENPLIDARYYANLQYKNSEYVNQIFKRENLEPNSIVQSENCVLSKNKCQLAGYRLMNHILRTHDLTRNRLDFKILANSIKSNIHLLGIEAKSLFSADENRITFLKLRKIKSNIFFHQLESSHGQDAYLNETDQLTSVLIPIFRTQKVIMKTKLNYNPRNYYINNPF